MTNKSKITVLSTSQIVKDSSAHSEIITYYDKNTSQTIIDDEPVFEDKIVTEYIINSSVKSKKVQKPLINKCFIFFLKFILAIVYLLFVVIKKCYSGIFTFCKFIKSVFANSVRHEIHRSYAAFAAMFCIIVCVFFVFNSFYDIGYEVLVDGEVVAAVNNKEDYLIAVSNVDSFVSNEYGNHFVSNANIQFEKNVFDKDAFTDYIDLEKTVLESNEKLVDSYVLNIDRVELFSLPSKEEAKKVLDEYKTSFMCENSVDAYFNNQIEITEKYVPTTMEKTIDEGIAVLNALAVPAIQMAKKSQQGISTAEYDPMAVDLEMKNMNAKNIAPQVTEVPLLEVITVEKETYVEPIAHTSTTVESDTMYVGKRKTTTVGSEGSKQVTINIKKTNGVEINRMLESEVVLTPPVNEVITIGTKPIPKGIGTGDFSKPTSGSISSSFGSRPSLGYHTGIDVANDTGTSVKAADDGKVIFAGRQGNYGNLIIIDHQNGYQTYYAHNSSLLVKKGAIVEKGDKISRMGSSGRVTGPHLHFEIRKNGNPVNPYKYIY